MKNFEQIAPKPRQVLTHVSGQGEVNMVDVSHKEIAVRDAIATGRIVLASQTIELINSNQVAKGNVLATARIAGIQAAKQTSHLIPLCHPLQLADVDIAFETVFNGIEITCKVRTVERTGAEMEALTGVSVAALTIYDMCKAVDKSMVISDVRLVQKMKRKLPQVPE